MKFEIPRLVDVGGPTFSDGTIEALIATSETAKSLEVINERRKLNNFRPLELVTTNLIGNHPNLETDSKLSSTTIRKYLLDRAKH